MGPNMNMAVQGDELYGYRKVYGNVTHSRTEHRMRRKKLSPHSSPEVDSSKFLKKKPTKSHPKSIKDSNALGNLEGGGKRTERKRKKSGKNDQNRP